MKTLSIDIETYSDVQLPKTGVYRYCESDNFEILLLAYSIDSQPVQVVDLACSETIPEEIIAALEDDAVIKWVFNAAFERVYLSRFLEYPTGTYLSPESWPSTINKILRNEKYIGDALLQKTYTTDFLNKTKVKNTGIVPQYYIEGNHEAIIPREIYMRVQEELVRR